MYQRAILKLRRMGATGGAAAAVAGGVRRLEDQVARIRGREIVEVLGDSHAHAFLELNQQPGVAERYFFRVLWVKGATAFGLANPGSRTNALKSFRRWIAATPRDRKLLFMLGEVDAGFLVFWLAQQRGADPRDLLDDAVGRYTAFLAEVIETHPHITVASAPLPTIGDGAPVGEIAKARREVQASQAERTEMTLEFNRRLAAWCSERGLTFLDLDPASLDESTGLVRHALLNPNPKDHHYGWSAFARLLTDELQAQGALERPSAGG